MKRLLASVAAIAIAPFAAAQEAPDLHPVSEIISESGLAAGEAYLTMEALLTDGADTDFLLGGVRFLRGIEVMMQTRWDTTEVELGWLPGMRGDLPPNPDAKFDPAFLENALKAGLTQLARAEAPLERATQSDFGAAINLTHIWFDVSRDGEKQAAESLESIVGDLQGNRNRRARFDDDGNEIDPEPEFDGVIRFDGADADWLKAYVHVASGMAELTLSVDPTPAITRVTDSRNALLEYGPGFFDSTGWAQEEWVEYAAATLLTLRGEPDKVRTRAALAHFKSMIAHNRAFWSEVQEETDNDREWLPNPRQQSAFGIPVDEELAKSWQNILSEIELVLNGERLIPYWRTPNLGEREDGVGINIEKLLTDPGDMDLILWIQGEAVLPYLERGKIANMMAWGRFEQLTRGNGLGFAAWFN